MPCFHTHFYLPLECGNTDLVDDSLTEKWLSEMLLLNSKGGVLELEKGREQEKGREVEGRKSSNGGCREEREKMVTKRNQNHSSTCNIPQYGNLGWVKLSVVGQCFSENATMNICLLCKNI